MSNVHPWFANVSITNAADWTAQFFQTFNAEPAAALSNTPEMFIAETGWPSVRSDVLSSMCHFLLTYIVVEFIGPRQ